MEFEQRFNSEEACRDYLYSLRWADGFICPRCGSQRAWKTARGLYKCQSCNHQTSITAGTIFQDTKKPLQMWFRAMWYITNQKHGVSALGLQRAFGIGSYRTAWTLLHKLRYAMVRPGRDRLSGTVEVDETYIGGERAGKRGRGAAGKTLVLVAVQEDGNRIGRIRLRKVQDATGNSLCPAVQECVEPGSTVRTDGWGGYGGLEIAGYVHPVVRKDSNVGDNLLPLANRVVALLKRWLVGTHQGAVRSSHLEYYLDEFTFRFNRRKSRSRGMLFYRLLQQAVTIEPISSYEI